jgi:benzodiazapine receptor
VNFRSLGKLVIAIVVCELAGFIGSIFTVSAIPEWYNLIAKPDFAPPNWIFGPVWITLYALMGIAAFLIWQKGLHHKKVKVALGFFIAQLILNSLWSVIFFGGKSIGWGLIEIIVLWFAIVATLVDFYKISKPAGALLIPYLLWVTFAVYLNFSLYMLNSYLISIS